MKVVLFDSSFLIAVAERPTTWREDITQAMGAFEPTILDRVRDELRGLAKGRHGRKAMSASVAEELARGFRVVDSSDAADVDSALISCALRLGAAVATIDSDLLDRLEVLHVVAVTLRGGRAQVS